MSKPTITGTQYRISRIGHPNQAYGGHAGWVPKPDAYLYSETERISLTLPVEGCWEVVASTPDAYCRMKLAERLLQNPPLKAICDALNERDQWYLGIDKCAAQPFHFRDLSDQQRLVGIAESALSLLDPELIDQAVEAMAECAVEIDYDGLRLLDALPNEIQARIRRTCRSLLSAARTVLEGRP